jgi:hypothetical protein
MEYKLFLTQEEKQKHREEAAGDAAIPDMSSIQTTDAGAG